MALKFITGNKGKFNEVKATLVPFEIELLDIDLDEIQEIDPYKVIAHKLEEAFKHYKGNFIIEDTSTYYQAFNNQLPGTFMKWFLKALGNTGLYELAKKLGSTKCKMEAIIVYAKNKKEVYFFKGTTYATVVKPRAMGPNGFGLDPILKPVGSKITLSELKTKGLGQTKFSPRIKAAKKLKKFLLKNDYGI